MTKIIHRLLSAFGWFFWLIPLGALVAGIAHKISDGWVVILLIGGTVVAWWILAAVQVVDNRHMAAREELVFEAAKQDSRPFCMLLRSFSDVQLGYGLPFTQLGDKGQRQDEGPVHFQALANGLGDAGRLLVLCREPIDDSRLRSGDFEHIGLRAPDEGWLDLFRYAAEGARAIVVVPGVSAGLMEELWFIRSEPSLLRKTLVYMPHTPPERVGNTFYFERERQEAAWRKVQAAWANSRLWLPDYEAAGTIYVPREDYSIDRRVDDLSVNKSAVLKDIIDVIAPPAAAACTTANMLAVAMSRGATRLETAKSEARESWEIALAMVFFGAVIAIAWWLYAYLN